MNGSGDRGSIPGRVISKTQKMVLNGTLLNTQDYKIQIKSKWSNPRKGVTPSLTPRCSSYWKESLWVPSITIGQLQLNFSRPTGHTMLLIRQSDSPVRTSSELTVRCLGRVLPNTLKIVLNASLLNTQHFKVWIKGKWNNPGKGVAPCLTPW